MPLYWFRQECSRTGEDGSTYLTEEEKRELESKPEFKGWNEGELIEVSED
jgi:hypothetical protein